MAALPTVATVSGWSVSSLGCASSTQSETAACTLASWAAAGLEWILPWLSLPLGTRDVFIFPIRWFSLAVKVFFADQMD